MKLKKTDKTKPTSGRYDGHASQLAIGSMLVITLLYATMII